MFASLPIRELGDTLVVGTVTGWSSPTLNDWIGVRGGWETLRATVRVEDVIATAASEDFRRTGIDLLYYTLRSADGARSVTLETRNPNSLVQRIPVGARVLILARRYGFADPRNGDALARGYPRPLYEPSVEWRVVGDRVEVIPPLVEFSPAMTLRRNGYLKEVTDWIKAKIAVNEVVRVSTTSMPPSPERPSIVIHTTTVLERGETEGAKWRFELGQGTNFRQLVLVLENPQTNLVSVQLGQVENMPPPSEPRVSWLDFKDRRIVFGLPAGSVVPVVREARSATAAEPRFRTGPMPWFYAEVSALDNTIVEVAGTRVEVPSRQRWRELSGLDTHVLP